MEPDEGHDIEIEYIPYPEFDRFVELEKYVTKSQKGLLDSPHVGPTVFL